MYMSKLSETIRSNIRKRLSSDSLSVVRSKVDLCYVTERRRWVIQSDGQHIVENLTERFPEFSYKVTSRPFLTNATITHYGSQFMFQNWLKDTPLTNKIVVSFYHGKYGDEVSIDRNLDFLLSNAAKVDRIVVSFMDMKTRLVELGLDENLIVKIPIGVATDVFTPPKSKETQQTIRRKIGIPNNHLIIGSFQKDGTGWKKGMMPKLIKGPDLLLESISYLSQAVPIFVLLTGPARGYVTNGLKERDIPFLHLDIVNETTMADMYKALDLYLITSREEGGPKGLLEALSSGCPVVTTPVGMARDLIPYHDFFDITHDFEPISIAEKALNMLQREIEDESRAFLREIVSKFDWKTVSENLM